MFPLAIHASNVVKDQKLTEPQLDTFGREVAARPKVDPPYTPCTFDNTHPSRRRSSSYPFSYSKLYDKVLTMSNMDITSNPVSAIAETSRTTETEIVSSSC